MIWYIWWLAAISLVGIVVACIVHSFNDDVDYYVQVDEIEEIENAYREQVAQAEEKGEVNHAS
jgi:cytochrome o ubiquinol oxidase subunit 1